MADRAPAVDDPCPAQIRVATSVDAEALLPLIYAHAAYEQGKAGITLDVLRQTLDTISGRIMVWVAEHGGAVIGYAAATVEFSFWTGRDYLHLDCLFVLEDWRGAKVGVILMAAVRRHAAAQRLAELQWQTPLWNDRAIRFYQREGAASSRKMRFTLPVPRPDCLASGGPSSDRTASCSAPLFG